MPRGHRNPVQVEDAIIQTSRPCSFSNPETFSLGFVTRETLPTFPNTDQAETVVVFVPTAPNPTSGFIMMFKASEVHYIDMKVKEAFKTIISCGVIYPDFKVVPKNCREET